MWAISSFMAITGCLNDYHPMTAGNYVSGDGDERVAVIDSEICFHVRIRDEDPTSYIDRTYSYSVQQDGRIRVRPMRSVDAVYGVGRFRWYWDGQKIIQEDPKSGRALKQFVLDR